MGNSNSFDVEETDKYTVFQQTKNTILLQDKATGKELCLK
mgnify:CR=1 FL=1